MSDEGGIHDEVFVLGVNGAQAVVLSLVGQVADEEAIGNCDRRGYGAACVALQIDEACAVIWKKQGFGKKQG